MGEKRIHGKLEEDSAREFTRAILNDLNALERMITDGLIEDGIRRVGAEQEMALVDRRGCAAPVAQGMMQILHDDPRFQTEVALFNLEANLDPQTLGGPFLRHLEHELNDVLTAARRAASDIEADVVLTGILPSLRRSDVTRDNLTPEPRYALLDTVSLAAQDGEIRIAVDGLDRFEGRFDTVVVEGVNTSLQLHLQVNVGDAARLYNLAQLITAPLLAASTNSPVIMGKRIWHETRVAVFERALDDRTGSKLGRGVPTRVGFGSSWLQDSLVELFKDNIARFPIIMTREIETDPMQELDRGEIPKLKALNLHNGTVWRWNRPCFGLTDGVPHLRIENRILPAGPTVLDEVANSALFYGLIVGLDDSYGEVKERLQFSQARENFIASAHYGLDARYTWLDGRRTGARELLLGELLPAARKGLASIAVPDEDIDRYIGVVEQRVESGRTGSSWLMEGLSEVPEDERPALSRHAVSLMLERQQADAGVHEWPHLRALESDQES
ncbi:MAG: hypothetical protein HKN49_04255, partial [Gammaproteobacteria bacterium]|nr:hypothetical protein [Gammaproteobacteria bacterium]